MATYIRDRRVERNIKQADLAQKSGVPQGNLSRIEGGSLGLSVENAVKMAPTLGMSATDLFAQYTLGRIDAAIKSAGVGRGELHRAIAALEDLREETDSEGEQEVLDNVISDLKTKADSATKSKRQRVPSMSGRDGKGRRRREAESSTRSESQRERDGYGRRR